MFHRSEPFALKDSPLGLCNIQMWTIWRKEKEKQTTLLPYRTKFLHEFTPMNTCIIKYNKCVLTNVERKTIYKVGYLVGRHVFSGRESLISVITVHHAEDVESQSSFGRDIDILTAELPSIWYIFLGANMALISIVKINESIFLLLYEFLQLLGLIRIASFAFFRFCMSFSMALRTVSSSEQSMIGFRPRPGRVPKPLMPSVVKRFTQKLTEILVISVWRPTCFEVRPADFKSTARQRIRYAWLLPWRKPSTSWRRCWSVSCITFIFAMSVSVYLYNAPTNAKIMI